MFERYSERARRVLFFARSEATQTGSHSIGSGHLVLGLCRETGGTVGRLFDRASLTVEAAREAALATIAQTPPGPTSHEIPFDADVLLALRRAVEEADRLGATEIGPEHLLLGILGDAGSPAAAVFEHAGLTIDVVRSAVGQERLGSVTFPVARADTTEVRIAPAATGSSPNRFSGSPSHISYEGVTLRTALSRLCELPEPRIDLPDDLDVGRYDFFVSLPRSEPGNALAELLLEAIFNHFAVSIDLDEQPASAFIVTAPPELAGVRARTYRHEGGGGLGVVSVDVELPSGSILPTEREWMTDGVTHGMTISGSLSPEVLCTMLEQLLGRPVVDETGLEGVFEVQLSREAKDADDLFALLRDEIGLAVTEGERVVPRLQVCRQ